MCTSISHQNKLLLYRAGGVLVAVLGALTALALARITTGSFLTSYFKTCTIAVIAAGTAGGSALIITLMLYCLYKRPPSPPHSGLKSSPSSPEQPLRRMDSETALAAASQEELPPLLHPDPEQPPSPPSDRPLGREDSPRPPPAIASPESRSPSAQTLEEVVPSAGLDSLNYRAQEADLQPGEWTLFLTKDILLEQPNGAQRYGQKLELRVCLQEKKGSDPVMFLWDVFNISDSTGVPSKKEPSLFVRANEPMQLLYHTGNGSVLHATKNVIRADQRPALCLSLEVMDLLVPEAEADGYHLIPSRRRQDQDKVSSEEDETHECEGEHLKDNADHDRISWTQWAEECLKQHDRKKK